MSTHAPRINRPIQLGRFLILVRLLLWMLWVMYRERRRVIRTHAPGSVAAQPASPTLTQVLAVFRDAVVKENVLLIKLGQFLSTRPDQLDYVREAANARRFRELFKDDPTIYIPQVYDQYVSRRLLVLEWIEGITIDDYRALEAAGINHFELARRTVNAYFYQFFIAGFFHADPHPGNLFVRPGPAGSGPTVIFVDFGMVGSYTKPMRRFMKQAFLAVLARDSRALVNALSQLGFIGEEANLASIEHSMSQLVEYYADLSPGEVRELGFATLLQEIGQLLYGQSLRIPAQFAFTGRALGLLMGLVQELAPEFNFIEVATPYARAFLGLDGRGMEQAVQQLLGQALAAGRGAAHAAAGGGAGLVEA